MSATPRPIPAAYRQALDRGKGRDFSRRYRISRNTIDGIAKTGEVTEMHLDKLNRFFTREVRLPPLSWQALALEAERDDAPPQEQPLGDIPRAVADDRIYAHLDALYRHNRADEAVTQAIGTLAASDSSRGLAAGYALLNISLRIGRISDALYAALRLGEAAQRRRPIDPVTCFLTAKSLANFLMEYGAARAAVAEIYPQLWTFAQTGKVRLDDLQQASLCRGYATFQASRGGTAAYRRAAEALGRSKAMAGKSTEALYGTEWHFGQLSALQGFKDADKAWAPLSGFMAQRYREPNWKESRVGPPGMSVASRLYCQLTWCLRPELTDRAKEEELTETARQIAQYGMDRPILMPGLPLATLWTQTRHEAARQALRRLVRPALPASHEAIALSTLAALRSRLTA